MSRENSLCIKRPQILNAEEKMITKKMDVAVKGIDKKARTADFVLSTPAVDRDGDCMSDNWILDAYRKNPIILWAHKHDYPVVGNALRIGLEGRVLTATDEFVTREMSDFGGMIGDMVLEGWVRSVSVGVLAVKWVYNEERNAIDFLEQELLEHSIVNIPAHRDALIKMKASGLDIAPMYTLCAEALDQRDDNLITKGFEVGATRHMIEEARKIADPAQRVQCFVSGYGASDGGADLRKKQNREDHVDDTTARFDCRKQEDESATTTDVVADALKRLAVNKGRKGMEMEDTKKQTDEVVKAAEPNIDTLIGAKFEKFAENFEAKLPEQLKKALDTAKVKGTFEGVQSTEPDGWKGIGDFTRAVILKDTGRFIDPRFQKDSMNTLSPTAGGALVPATLVNRLMDEVNSDPISLLDRINLITGVQGSVEFLRPNDYDRTQGAVFGGATAHWTKEGDAPAYSTAKPDYITLEGRQLMALMRLTNKFIANAGPISEAFATRALSEAASFALNAAIFEGKGAGNAPLGIMESGSLIAVSKETGQDAATVTAQNVIDMYARMLSRSKPRAVWLINPDVMPQLQVMAIGVGTAGFAGYMPPNGLSEAPFGTLLGRPLIEFPHCSELGKKGDIVLADLSQYIGVLNGSAAGVEVSLHLEFDKANSILRLLLEFDGQTWHNKPHKPPKETTKSAFITLETRS